MTSPPTSSKSAPDTVTPDSGDASSAPVAAPGRPLDWIDRWFGDLPRLRTLGDMSHWMADEGLLRVEEFADGDQMVVRADMPGIDPETDVEITVSDHTLTIRAERRQQSSSEDAQGFRSEFRYGTFTRSVPLPAGATAQDVSASYTDGVLEVRIPVEAGPAGPRTVSVERG